MKERITIARWISASVLRAFTSKRGSAFTDFRRLKPARYFGSRCATVSHGAKAGGRLMRGSAWGRNPRVSLNPNDERSQSAIHILELMGIDRYVVIMV
jgi:hypothetical protein